MLRTFQGADNAELHVHVGRKQTPDPNDDGYISALGLCGTEIVYDGTLGWLASCAASAMRGHTILVLPAGEITYPQRTRPYWGWWTALLTAMPLLRGGTAVQVGAGVRMPPSASGPHAGRLAWSVMNVPVLERYARRKMPVIGWRDAETQGSFQLGDVVPDWAFGEGPDPETEGLGAPPSQRSVLAVTTRADRDMLSEDKIRLLHDIAHSRGLRIQVYSQVSYDRENMERLAHRLHPGRDALLFGDESHADWEKKIRALHRESAIVASDRLHALVIGATEGAIPLAVSNSTAEKAIRTLKPGGFTLPNDAPEAVNKYLDEMLADDSAVSQRIVTARARLDAVRGSLRALICASAQLQRPSQRSPQATRNAQRRLLVHGLVGPVDVAG
jgi:hypothetical protein